MFGRDCPKSPSGWHKRIKNPKRHLHQSDHHRLKWWVGPEFVCAYCSKRYPPTHDNWIVQDA